MDGATGYHVFIYEVLWSPSLTGTEMNWMDAFCDLRFLFSLPRFENPSPIPFPACPTTFVLQALMTEFLHRKELWAYQCIGENCERFSLHPGFALFVLSVYIPILLPYTKSHFPVV
jgi:hypothetical protein